MGNHTGPALASSPGRRMAYSTSSLDAGRTLTFLSYCSGARICSRMAPNCTSPQVPRSLTLVKTRLRSPTPVAKVCISPSPRCTASSLSLTILKDSPMRFSKALCNCSSTVFCICSSFFSLLSCNDFILVSMVSRSSLLRASFFSLSSLTAFSIALRLFC